MAQATPVASTASAPFALAVEQRAREFLAQGKWRKARDEIKPLVKLDRERYLPLLIQANLGLVRELGAKGMLAEARQVMDYLASIAPPEQLRAARLELAGETGPTPDLLGQSAVTLAESASALPEAERLRLADQLVLAFAPLPAGSPALERLGAEVRALHQALEAVSSQQWERLTELLRPISLRSPLGHWAAFIKGLAAFHTGDPERAARLFELLPAASAPAKASRAYLVLAGRQELPQANPKLAEVLLDAISLLLGQPGAGRRLLPAERFWQEGRYVESYRVFRDGLPQFPTADQTWLGVLSEFYFQAPFAMSFAQRDKYFEFLDNLPYRHATKNPVEEMRLLRLLALAEDGSDAVGFKLDWEGFLRAREKVFGPNPKLASLGYGWLGEQLSRVTALPGFLGPDPERVRLRDAAGARHALLKAIELDPTNLSAHLQLSLVYRTLKEHSQRNRLLDQMVKRFPNEKRVLLENATGCLERKAYVKGLDYLERARALDRLDPAIPNLMVMARRHLARQQFQQGHPDKARQTLEPIQQFLNDNPADLQCSRWTHWMRQGLMEHLYGEAAHGAELLGRARAASPFAAAFLFFAHLTYRLYARPAKADSPFLAELRAELKQSPSAARASVLLRLFQFWDQASELLPDAPSLRAEAKLLRGYLNSALKQPFTRAEARELLELCTPKYFEAQARAFLKAMLRRDPNDPWFRLFDYMINPQWAFSPEADRAQLQSILDEARRRGDQELIPKIQGLIKGLEHPPRPPFFDEPEFDEDEDFDAGPEDFGPLLPPLPKGKMAEMAKLMNALANASEEEIRELRRTWPKHLPASMFDMLLEAARSGAPLPPAPPKPSGKPRSRRPNPNQPDLF